MGVKIDYRTKVLFRIILVSLFFICLKNNAYSQGCMCTSELEKRIGAATLITSEIINVDFVFIQDKRGLIFYMDYFKNGKIEGDIIIFFYNNYFMKGRIEDNKKNGNWDLFQCDKRGVKLVETYSFYQGVLMEIIPVQKHKKGKRKKENKYFIPSINW